MPNINEAGMAATYPHWVRGVDYEFADLSDGKGIIVCHPGTVLALEAVDLEAVAASSVPFIQAEQVDAVIASYAAAIQQRLDDFVQSRGYDSILSACTYATSVVPRFKSEAQYCVEARDATWAACYAIMGEVQAGQRAMPTLDEVMIQLPELMWPDLAV